MRVKQVGNSYRIFSLYQLIISNLSYFQALLDILCDEPLLISFSEHHTFKKKRQLINSTDLNRLLRSPIYPHPNGQLHAAYLILRYSLVYWSFQASGKAITIKHHLLPYIDVHCKGYILSLSKCACWEKGRYWSNSPPSFTPVDLGVTIVEPTPVDCLRWDRKSVV